MAVFCSRCGKPLPDGAAFCPSCGTTVQATGSVAGSPAGGIGATPGAIPADWGGAAAEPAAATAVRYAGFWLRFWAFVVDGFIIGIIMLPFGLGLLGSMVAVGQSTRDTAEALAGLIAASMVAWMLRLVVSWLYSALFESSAWQATPGKKLLGLRVTDLEGRKISFMRATGRALGKWLSGLVLCIGYIMVAFTDRKQGLHDILAGTVVRR